MGRKLVPKVILEGTRLTFKTDTAFALNEHPRIVGPRKYRYHSPIISGEWCGFTNHPWGRGLINFAPDEAFRAMEAYATWARLFELQRYYSWIIDRFHLSAKAFQHHTHGVEYDFTDLERRLRALNFRVVLLTRRPETFEAARTQRLKVSGNPAQYDDIGYFIAEQERLRDVVRASLLDHLELDVSDLDPAQAADEIADWLESTGGLYLD
ncbi:MAG: hypothetical protein CVU56_04125 [Deltaproteobacteria bacterium HGW-Deltaproteobacteria-14]|jgi:hypothetical protein|nr:MAG: hypothetical protein CVU56_04125 [Deltaproteobacteria bacterium HGW-Deltaproteobacteria-14]